MVDEPEVVEEGTVETEGAAEPAGESTAAPEPDAEAGLKLEGEPERGEGEEGGEVEPQPLHPRLIHAAERAGLSEEDINALGDKAGAVLSKFADHFDSVSNRYAEMGTAVPQSRGLFDEDVPLAEPGAAEVREPARKAKGEEEAWKLDYDREYVGEELAGKVLDPLISEVGQMRAELNAIRKQRLMEQRQLAETASDQFFSGLGKEYESLYGKGKSRELDPNSNEWKSRAELLDKANLIASGAIATGRQIPFQDAVDMALSIHAGSHQKSIQRKALRGKLKQRESKMIQRPTARRTEEAYANPYQKAVDAVREVMKKRDLTWEE